MTTSRPDQFQRVLVVVNPVSGQSDPEQTVAELTGLLDQGDVAYELRRTAGAGDAGRWAGGAAADGFDALIVAGGDGTVAECAGGIVRNNSHVPMLIVPNGTANVIANVAGIPATLNEAVALLESGSVRRLDVGYLPEHDRHFLLAIAIGYPASVVVEAPRPLKDRFGFGAYLWAAVANLWNPTQAEFTITFDGAQHSATGHAALVSNLGILSVMGVELGSQVIPDDGLLDVYVAESESLAEFLRAAGDFVVGQRDSENLSHFTTRSAIISAEPPLLVQADGEPLGETPLTVEIRESALSLLVPAEDP